MATNEDKDGSTSRWQALGLGKKITLGSLIPSLMLGLVWVVTNIDKVEKFVSLIIGKPSVVVAPPSLPSLPPPCYTLEVKTFETFPYYLVNTYNKNPEHKYIYWTSITGKNDCPDDLNFTVKFSVNRGQDDPGKIVTVKREQIDDSISRGKSLNNKRMDPIFEFLSGLEDDIRVFVEWKIINQVGSNVITQGNKHILVKMKNVVSWDLKNPDSSKVDTDFLLASLSAWSLKPGTVLRTRAHQYLQGTRESREWLENCYQDLFHATPPVVVRPFPGRWPPSDTQEIQTPKEILTTRKANSLEAALLIAALKNAVAEDLGLHLVLFALEQEESHGAKHFLLAWSTDRQEWHAMDMTAPSQVSFTDNVTQASLKLKAFFQAQGQEMWDKLEEKGVFISPDQDVLVLDFQKASEKYSIGSLKSVR